MLQGILHEVVPDREGLLSCKDLARCLRRPDPAPEPQKGYDLAQKQGLADLLRDADIRLVRADFILKLQHDRQRLPRRQEAESAYVDGRTALVTHEEVRCVVFKQSPTPPSKKHLTATSNYRTTSEAALSTLPSS
ncbi:nhaD [Symbiodinium sp. CCMP2592]|nr:nhaD [Symbiodinium sp. CCMP2592]